MRAALRATGTLLLASALRLASAQTPTTEAEMAAILGHDAECVPYGIPLTVGRTDFPQTATMVTVPDVRNDTDGFALFQKINGSIPNIPPKVAGAPYDTVGDPDCFWPQTQCTASKRDGIKPDIAMAPEPRTLGYGFDDGPACDHNEFYNFLADKGQKATMFYIGIYVMWSPLQAMRAAADGHEICVHTWSHGNMTQLTNEQAFAELWYTRKAIKLVTGYTPTCWRPPHGDVDDRIRFIAQSLNLDTIMWKFDSFDWSLNFGGVTADDVQNNYNTLISAAKNGSLDTHGAIILAHELSNFTMGKAVENYPAIIDAFDYVVPVSVALNKTQPYVETNFTWPTFADYAAAHPPQNGKGSSTSTGGSNSSSSTSTGSGSTTSSGSKGNSSGISGASAGVAVVPNLGFATTLAVLGGVVALFWS